MDCNRHSPKPLRLVKHHVLPEVCGGKDTILVCDNCHYGIHRLLYDLKEHNGQFITYSTFANTERARIAREGYIAAVANGTVDLIPKELLHG